MMPFDPEASIHLLGLWRAVIYLVLAFVVVSVAWIVTH